MTSRTYHSLALILLCTTCIVQCGSNRELTGIWQQVPLNDSDSFSQIPVALYELHLGQYGDKVTGLSVRYRKPEAEFLSTFERTDRCDCHYIVQGKNEEQVAFTLLQTQQEYSISTPINCQIEVTECKRIFLLNLEDDELVGETWCENSNETVHSNRSTYLNEVIAVRFIRSNGIPTKECKPVE